MGTKKLARYGLLLALALVFSYVESRLPLSMVAPGVKLGVTNIVVVFALYRLGGREACVLSLVRVVLVSITFGNAFSFWYSLAGAALSLLVMLPMKRSGWFGCAGVSVAGGVCHNLGQIAVAMAVLRSTAAAAYLPVLLCSGVVAGVCIGLVSAVLIRRIPA